MYTVHVPRDLATHATLPGITLGDIGSKLAFNMVDNGFCVFDHVHVPASQLCLATARVRWQRSQDDSGGPVNLVAAPAASSKWKYMPMMKTRVFLIAKCARLSAATSLLPHVGLSFAATFAGRDLLELYETVQLHRTKQDRQPLDLGGDQTDRLAALLHATSSGLKALVAARVVDGIECCARQCPPNAEFLTQLRRDIVGASTYEGTFDVLVQQHASFLAKTRPQEGHAQMIVPLEKDWTSMATLVRWFHFRAHSMLMSFDTANVSMVRATRLSVVHSEATLLQALHAFLTQKRHQCTITDVTATSLTAVGKALAYRWMVDSLHEFRVNGWLSSADGDEIVELLTSPTSQQCQEWMAVTASWDFMPDEVPSMNRGLRGKL
ncbi:hypothetical protein DYB36_008489 [Aphanomyces astaci]|uniref:Acyl-CoA oxidase C-alpha1 domain-containing protein n=1 Tax=Aphanomyces astaci TaxID=112090 RepID=A0A397B2B2_APHAT|nr:hypothetical protein DYB36_008489 [Aphanomyces astaci]